MRGSHLEHQPNFQLVAGVVIADQAPSRLAFDDDFALRANRSGRRAAGSEAGRQSAAPGRFRMLLPLANSTAPRLAACSRRLRGAACSQQCFKHTCFTTIASPCLAAAGSSRAASRSTAA